VNAVPMDADYTPRYIRLARLLRGRIEDGTYPRGSLLPSANRLAELHTVSKATATHALEVLVKSGHARHIESKPHQVIWRQAGSDETPIAPHEQGDTSC
jgi:DNA-binding transcriptional MocR family regulator